MTRYLAATAVIALLTAGGALAQTATTPPGFITEQPASESSASILLGDKVTNAAGETIGDVDDLLFDAEGRIKTAVLGVGGFLGIGEKKVAVPFATLSLSRGGDGSRVVTAPALSKQALTDAPEFKLTEKTTFMKAKETVTDMGNKTMEKAGELRDQAAKKIDEMTGNESKP